MQLNSKNNSKYSTFSKRLMAWGSIVIVSFTITFSYVGTVNAGLFSFVSSMLSGEQVSAKENRPVHLATSQNMAILTATPNYDTNPDKIVDIVPIEDGKTLVADLANTNIGGLDVSNTQISTYIVREGDTISGVAQMFNVSMNTVLWANELTSKSVLRVGQTLVILPISGLNYTVKKGDTLQGIAKKYGADMEELLAFNDFSSNSTITVGQTIIIPNAELLAPQPSSSGTTKISNSSSQKSLPGYFMRPVSGGTKTQGLHGHNGVDIAGPVGTPILASASGKVIINRMNGAWSGGYGNYIVISHPNGTQTLYAHMSKSVVSVGQNVSKGQKIGTMGNTGLSTGPHLHFEIRGAKNPF